MLRDCLGLAVMNLQESHLCSGVMVFTPTTFSSVGVDLEKAYLCKGFIHPWGLTGPTAETNKGVESTSKGGLIIII